MTKTETSAQSAQVATTKASVKAGQVMTAAELPTTAQIGEKTKTARQLEASEKREQLKAISAELQAQRDLMQVMGVEDLPTINEMLHDYYAKKSNITELNTFDQWKDKGYQVRRGEKAFLFWGKPRSKQKQEEQPAEEQTEQEQQAEQNAKKDEYFPICYLFDISQCRKL